MVYQEEMGHFFKLCRVTINIYGLAFLEIKNEVGVLGTTFAFFKKALKSNDPDKIAM